MKNKLITKEYKNISIMKIIDDIIIKHKLRNKLKNSYPFKFLLHRYEK